MRREGKPAGSWERRDLLWSGERGRSFRFWRVGKRSQPREKQEWKENRRGVGRMGSEQQMGKGKVKTHAGVEKKNTKRGLLGLKKE